MIRPGDIFTVLADGYEFDESINIILRAGEKWKAIEPHGTSTLGLERWWVESSDGFVRLALCPEAPPFVKHGLISFQVVANPDVPPGAFHLRSRR